MSNTVEYLKMPSAGGKRNSYFKKTDGILNKISANEYKKHNSRRKNSSDTQSVSSEDKKIKMAIEPKDSIPLAKMRHVRRSRRSKKKKNADKYDDKEADNDVEEVEAEEEVDEASKIVKKSKRRSRRRTVRSPASSSSEMQNKTSRRVKTIMDIIKQKDSISNLLGSSFSNEDLGLDIGNSVKYTPQALIAGEAEEEPEENEKPEENAEVEEEADEERIDISDDEEQKGGRMTIESEVIYGGVSHILSRGLTVNDYENPIEPENADVKMYPNTIVKKQYVPKEFVDFDTTYEDYCPVEYTSETFTERDVDPENICSIKDDLKTRPGLFLDIVKPKFDDSGRPKNPYGRTGMRGRGNLPYWGCNWYNYPVFLKSKQTTQHGATTDKLVKTLEVLVHSSSKSLPIPMLVKKTNDVILISAKLDSFFNDDQIKELGISKEEFLSPEHFVEPRQFYLDSPRNTDNAWICMNVAIYNLSEAKYKDLYPNSCKNANYACEWITLDKTIKNKVSPEDYQILHQLLGVIPDVQENSEPEIAEQVPIVSEVSRNDVIHIQSGGRQTKNNSGIGSLKINLISKS